MFSFDLTNWMMVFARVGALLAVFPLFATQNIPVQVRLALGALVSFLVAPGLPPLANVPSSMGGMVQLLLIEVAVGLLLGFVSKLLFYILEFAGNIIASELGMNWRAPRNPLRHSRSEAPGVILCYLAALAFPTL